MYLNADFSIHVHGTIHFAVLGHVYILYLINEVDVI